MSHLPAAGHSSTCESQGRTLLKSTPRRVISAVNDANLIVVLIVFIAVCLLAVNVDVIAPDAGRATQFGPYP